MSTFLFIQIIQRTRCNRSLCVSQHISGVSPPIIRSIQLQYEPLVLPLERSGGSVVGRGLAELPNRGQQRNMLSHTQTSSNKLVKLLHLLGGIV
jgi:hypothetical protein